MTGYANNINRIRVILNQRATLDTIAQFHDQLSNELPAPQGKWDFTFKIFRNNPYSIEPELARSHEASTLTKYLYTLAPSYLRDTTLTLVNRKSSAVFTTSVAEESRDVSGDTVSIPDSHLHQGATTGMNDSFDTFVAQKLLSLWTQRQVIKGHGGQRYELENGNLIISTSNVFLHGNFKGLLIQIDVQPSQRESSANSVQDTQQLFESIKHKYNIVGGSMCCQVIDQQCSDPYGDLCLQYAETFNF